MNKNESIIVGFITKTNVHVEVRNILIHLYLSPQKRRQDVLQGWRFICFPDNSGSFGKNDHNGRKCPSSNVWYLTCVTN